MKAILAAAVPHFGHANFAGLLLLLSPPHPPFFQPARPRSSRFYKKNFSCSGKTCEIAHSKFRNFISAATFLAVVTLSVGFRLTNLENFGGTGFEPAMGR